MMNKVIIAISAVAMVGVGAFVLTNMSADEQATKNASTNESMSGMSETMQPNQQQTTMSAPMSNEVKSGEVAMDIANFDFSQENLKVKKGTMVTWTNRDTAKHDVTPEAESAAFMGSELLKQGESYSFTFTTPGTYNYICSPHPYMKAVIEVVE